MIIPIKAEEVEYKEQGERLPAGAYVGKVVSVDPVDGKQAILLTLNVMEGEHAGKQTKIWKSYEDNGKPDGYNPLYWFRQMLANFEKENQGRYKQTDLDTDHLVDLLIGVVLQDQEYKASTGEIRTGARFKNFAKIEDIRAGKVKTPAPKLLERSFEQMGEVRADGQADGVPF